MYILDVETHFISKNEGRLPMQSSLSQVLDNVFTVWLKGTMLYMIKNKLPKSWIWYIVTL